MNPELWMIVLYLTGFASGLALGWFRWREPHLRSVINDKALDDKLGLARLPTIRVNVEEAESMRAEAEALGLNLQSYVRYLLAFRPPRRR